MMIVIFLEGTDKSGKSTLAKKLADTFKLEYRHCSKPQTDNPFLEYVNMINSITKPTIFDRSYLGEYVYSQLWRGGLSMNSNQFDILDAMCKTKFKTLAIHAEAPLHIIKDRCISDKEDLLQLDQIDKCQILFREIMSQTKLPVLNYYSHTQQPSDIVDKLLHYF